VYFSQKYIGSCLDSLLAQTVTDDFEILCCGDRVEDPSHAIIEEYAEKHQGKVQLHLQEGRGPSGARNLGLSLAKGEYIMFVDADDGVEPDILTECEKALVDTDADFACVAFDRVSVDGKQRALEQFVSGVTTVDIVPENVARLAFIPTAPWGKLFKRDLLSGITFPEHPKSVYEDCIFTLSVCPRVKKYVMVPKLLYHYLVHDEQGIQTSASLEKSEKFRSDMVELRERYESDGLSEPYLRMLDIAALIHVGASDVHRIASNPDIPLRKFCAGAKAFLNESFPGWRKIKLRPYGVLTSSCIKLWIAKICYKLNIAWLAIRFMNWMNMILNKEVKW